MERVEFLYALGRVGVPAINLHDKEIDDEIAAAQELAVASCSANEVDAKNPDGILLGR